MSTTTDGRSSTSTSHGAIPAAQETPSPALSRAGIGLRAEHYRDVIEQRPPVGWLEVHSENYFGNGGRPLHYLDRIRTDYPVSLHGVGLSLGSTDPLSDAHLNKLKSLVQRCEPVLISEHLAWGSVAGRHFNDLLPLPYRAEELRHMVERVSQVQDWLQRPILIENLSSYLEYDTSDIPEWEFLAELARRSGCGILLDINNVYVSARNHGFDAQEYLRGIPPPLVGEIHLAGHTVKTFTDGELLIDTHDQRVTAAVWSLYRDATRRFVNVPVLIEWDAQLPALEVLVDEARRAQMILSDTYADVA